MHHGPVPAPLTPHRVVFVVYDGIQALDLTGPFEVFHGASSVLSGRTPARQPYSLVITSLAGGAVTTESGIQVMTVAASTVDEVDTLVVPGGAGAQAAALDHHIIALVRTLARRAERTVTVCSGAFVAAAAGLADGRRVTTHWARAAALRRAHPDVEVDADPIYIHDGNLWSSAGVTAGIDLALALVEHDHDAEVAQVVARWLVMFLRRPGGQSQFATPIWTDRAETAPVRAAQDMIDSEPGADHRVAVVAARVNMSERHFTRCFTEETGMSPARYVARVRVETARRSLETSSATVDTIALRCGFGTAETMRRTFTRRLGVSPDQYRRRFRSTPS